LDEVKRLVEEDPKRLDEVVPGGVSPLFMAMVYGHFEVAKWLIRRQSAFFHRDSNRNTALHYAVYLRSPTLVKMLIKKGALVTDPSEGRLRGRALHLALLTNRIDIAQILMMHGARLEDVVSDGPNALFSALLLDRLEAFEWVHRHHPSWVYATDEEGATVFLRGVWAGSTKIVQWLLQRDLGNVYHGGSPRFKNSLFRAVSAGCFELASWLLENYPELNTKGKDGTMPYFIAAAEGRLECFKLLARDVENLATHHTDDTSTAMLWASGAGRLNIVEWLYQQGVPLDICEPNHWTAIHRASANGEAELVSWLLDHDVPVDLLDRSKWSALHLASEFGKLEVAKVLISRGADINMAVPSTGKTPFLIAIQTKSLAVAKYLHSLQPEVIHAVAKENQSAFHFAAHSNSTEVCEWLESIGIHPQWSELQPFMSHHSQHGRLETIKWFHSKGFDVTVPGSTGSNLANAVVGGKLDVVKFLVETCGMSVFEKLDRGGSLLCLAVRARQPEGVLEYLYQAGLSIHEVTNDGCNLIHRSITDNSLLALKWLVRHGLDLTRSSRSGTSPLVLACEHGHLHIVKWLLSKGALIAGPSHIVATSLTTTIRANRTEILGFFDTLGPDGM
jgi:ankyrin repeat protein